MVYHAEAWRIGTQFVAEQYREDGFLDATVEVRRITLDAVGGWVDVDVQVKEGVRTLVEAVVIDGNDRLSRKSCWPRQGSRRGRRCRCPGSR